jgi:hypothetical protein
MSKDPAVLFYTSDFLTGTMTMTNEQVGQYIRLLCLQHQKYTLTEKDMKNICPTYDEDIYSKFAKDENGYYNERMRNEYNKRKKYSESRANNRKGKTKKHMKNTSLTYEKHMENEDENENEDINKNDNEDIFAEVWKIYSKVSSRQPGSKKDAAAKFGKLKKKELEKIREHLPLFLKNHIAAQKTDYLPNFTTYLNQRRYEDEKLPYADSQNELDNWTL